MTVPAYIPMKQDEEDAQFHTLERTMERVIAIAKNRTLTAEDRLDAVMTDLFGKGWAR